MEKSRSDIQFSFFFWVLMEEMVTSGKMFIIEPTIPLKTDTCVSIVTCILAMPSLHLISRLMHGFDMPCRWSEVYTTLVYLAA